MICLEILLYIRNVPFVTDTFHVYQAFNFRKIKNLFIVSAKFCEIYFILQVLEFIFKQINDIFPFKTDTPSNVLYRKKKTESM